MTAPMSPPASQRLPPSHPSQPPRIRKGASPRLPLSAYVSPEVARARYRKTVKDLEAAAAAADDAIEDPEDIKKNNAIEDPEDIKKNNAIETSKRMETADNNIPPEKANSVDTK